MAFLQPAYNSKKIQAANVRLIAGRKAEMAARREQLTAAADAYAGGDAAKREAFLAGYQHALMPH
jgi:hypothetical protein